MTVKLESLATGEFCADKNNVNVKKIRENKFFIFNYCNKLLAGLISWVKILINYLVITDKKRVKKPILLIM